MKVYALKMTKAYGFVCWNRYHGDWIIWSDLSSAQLFRHKLDEEGVASYVLRLGVELELVEVSMDFKRLEGDMNE